MRCKEIVARHLAEAMKRKNISKTHMAALLKTSRRQIHRILNPTSDITLSTLERAALSVGSRVTVVLKPQWSFRKHTRGAKTLNS
jgi:plasmid maintenance system antidote protein VapI